MLNKDSILISIVTWNRKEALQKVLESIFEHSLGSYKIVITDNGSDDGTVDYLKSLSKKHPIDALYFKENLGIARARNAHWHKCVGYDVVRMDDDIVIKTDDWLNIYRDVAYSNYAFVGRTPETYWELLKGKEQQELIHADEAEGQSALYSVSGQLMFIPKNSVYTIGYWSEDYGMSGFEDIDYALKGKLLGYNQIFVNSVETEHLFETSNVYPPDDDKWRILNKNLAVFYKSLQDNQDESSRVIRFNLPSNKTVEML